MSSDPNLPSDPSPLPPTSNAVSPLGAAGGGNTEIGLPPNVTAALCLTFVVGVILLVLEKRNQFVRFWAMQSVLLGAVWVAFAIASFFIGLILKIVFLGWLWHIVAWLISVGFLVVWIVAIFQAFSGKAWEIPVIGKLAREQLAKTPTL